MSDHHIPFMDTFSLHVPLTGVEGDDSLNLHDGHISCMGTSFLHVQIAGVE